MEFVQVQEPHRRNCTYIIEGRNVYATPMAQLLQFLLCIGSCDGEEVETVTSG